jgi:hypothetical protein
MEGVKKVPDFMNLFESQPTQSGGRLIYAQPIFFS